MLAHPEIIYVMLGSYISLAHLMHYEMKAAGLERSQLDRVITTAQVLKTV